MKKYILVILFLGVKCINAQIFLTGVVKDKFTLEELSYASISFGGKALCVTDENGRFKIKLPEKADSLHISFVGYQSLSILSVELSTQDTNILLLQPKKNSFNDIEISGDGGFKKVVRTGSKKKKNVGEFYCNSNCQMALFFPNEKHRKGVITKVGYYITDKGNPHTNFRVRVYKAGKNLEPDGDILTQNIVVHDSLNGNNWVDVDLEKLRIKIPEYGFFVAMEWLPESDNYVYALKIGSHTSEYTGQVLGATSEFNRDLRWSIDTKGDGFLHKKPEEVINYLNPKIRAELKIK